MLCLTMESKYHQYQFSSRDYPETTKWGNKFENPKTKFITEAIIQKGKIKLLK